MVDHKSNTLTVTVTADTAAFEAAMDRIVKSIQRVELAIIDLEDRRRVRLWDRLEVEMLDVERALKLAMARIEANLYRFVSLPPEEHPDA